MLRGCLPSPCGCLPGSAMRVPGDGVFEQRDHWAFGFNCDDYPRRQKACQLTCRFQVEPLEPRITQVNANGSESKIGVTAEVAGSGKNAWPLPASATGTLKGLLTSKYV